MEEPSSHGIGEQHTAYRRGLVLGLTMAEVGILIIFVLLLLIAFGELLRQAQMREVAGQRTVPAERLQSLERGESQLSAIRQALRVGDGEDPAEIRRLVRVLQEVASRPESQSLLQETRAATEEMRRVRDTMTREGVPETLTAQLQQQSFRIANQEGQLQRYESLLKEAGLGKGERPCWVKPDGAIEYLYDVVLASDGIRMREYAHENRVAERSLLPMPQVDPTEFLSTAEFLRRTQPLYDHSLAVNCRFFVVIYDGTGPTEKDLYKHLLRTVEGHFYKRLDRGPSPF